MQISSPLRAAQRQRSQTTLKRAVLSILTSQVPAAKSLKANSEENPPEGEFGKEKRMSQTEKKDRPDDVGTVEVESLTDADLESVAGGSEAEIVNNVRTGCSVNSNVANACC
jgi:hypothetical protein